MKGVSMDLEQLIQRFFDYRKVQCEGIEVEYSVLKRPDMFLPVLMLLVQKSVNNTILEEVVLSFNVRKREGSLCFLIIEELDLHSLNSVANIIEELIYYDLIPGIILNNKLEVEVSDLVLNCRKVLGTFPEGAFFSCDALFTLIFGESFTLNLSEEFIRTQAEVLTFCEEN